MPVAWSDRRRILSALLSAIVISVGFAGAGAASEASAPIEQLDAGLIQAMKAGKAAPFRQRYDLLAPLIARAIDLDLILQSAIGGSWASLAPDQQAALRTAFQRFSVASYVANFDDFAGERFELLPATGTAGGDPIVRVRIVPGSGGGDTHVLDYAMQQRPGGWKAVDVMADGSISQVAAQKDEIRSLFIRSGAAGLLARLQQKTADLSGGALR